MVDGLNFVVHLVLKDWVVLTTIALQSYEHRISSYLMREQRNLDQRQGGGRLVGHWVSMAPQSIWTHARKVCRAFCGS